jgi:hypothetical protein
MALDGNFESNEEFTVGSVISLSWRTLWTKPLAFLGMTLLSFIIPVAVTVVLALILIMPGQSAAGMVITGGGAMISYGISMTLFQGAITYAAFKIFMGDRASVPESLGRSFSRLPALLGLGGVIVLAVVALACVSGILGLIARVLAVLVFLVTFVIFFGAWYVGTQACIVENAGPMASLGRSWDLTKGYRLQITGMLLLVFILVLITTAIAQFIVNRVLGVGIAGSLFNMLVNLIPIAFGNVMATVTYYRLRVVKEGLTATSLADIFD